MEKSKIRRLIPAQIQRHIGRLPSLVWKPTVWDPAVWGPTILGPLILDHASHSPVLALQEPTAVQLHTVLELIVFGPPISDLVGQSLVLRKR